MQNNNPFTEIGAIILAILLVIAGGLLLYLGKIDFTQATLIWGLAAALFGGNLALKAPSSTQQTQLSNLQGSLQDLVSLFASHTHPVVPPPPSPPTQPVQPVKPTGIGPNPPDYTTNAPIAPSMPPVATQTYTPQFVPDPNVSMAAYQTGMMPKVTPPAVQP